MEFTLRRPVGVGRSRPDFWVSDPEAVEPEWVPVCESGTVGVRAQARPPRPRRPDPWCHVTFPFVRFSQAFSGILADRVPVSVRRAVGRTRSAGLLSVGGSGGLRCVSRQVLSLPGPWTPPVRHTWLPHL